MASITSLSNSYSAASSIYGNKNILSGLASGMDTESMIENAVSGIKTKISTLNQKRTKVEWQQEALRSIIDKMANFSNKYTSYASSTNLLSASFFNSAVKVAANGANADKVSASGRTSSSVEILGVKQLAKNATYNVSGSRLLAGGGDVPTIQGDAINFSDVFTESNTAGTMSIAYGGARTIDITLDDTVYTSKEDFVKAINQKLSETNVTKKDGEVAKASSMVEVKVGDDGAIHFTDKQNAGNSVYISGASGKLEEMLKGVGSNPQNKPSVIKMEDKDLSTNHNRGEFLSEKEFKVTLDGVTKTITLNKSDKNLTPEDLRKDLQEKLDTAFGTNKFQVANNATEDGKFQLKITTEDKSSTATFQGDAAKALGLGSTRETTFLDTGKTLGQLLDESTYSKFDKIAAEGDVREIKNENGDGTGTYVDSKGNSVMSDDDGNYYQVDAKGDALFNLKVNDVVVGKFSKNTALESVVLAINNSDKAGVTATFSKTTGEFQFKAKESGVAGRIEFDGQLGEALFGSTKAEDGGFAKGYTAGQDAIFSMRVNGKEFENATRSSNSFEVDGMTLGLKGTFNYDDTGALDKSGEAVTFTSSADSDKIVDAVKAMVNDYNEMANEIKSAYTTMRATRSGSGNNAKYYEPLTAEDAEGMSETEIKNWNEKAKQGLLFGDRDLTNLYEQLTDAISPSGTDGSLLRSLGIETAYSGGMTTLSLDEDKLRAALETNPEGVREAFTKSKENGASSNGLMQNISAAVDRYGKTTGTKGILVERAGSARAPVTLNNNTIQDQLNDFDEQIERWETKLSNQIDRYTSQFSKLEQLIAQMNSQSSALSGLMGGY